MVLRRSFFTTHSGALFVTPGGQSEQALQFKDAGYQWGAVNIADGHPPADWSETVRQFASQGIRVAVWGRVRNSSIEELMGAAIMTKKPCILNLEDELKAPGAPARIEEKIKAIRRANRGWTRELLINTVGWLYNDVDYTPLAHRPFQLQILIQDMRRLPRELPDITRDCIAHAKAKGIKDVSVCFQTYGEAEPGWYDFWKGPRGLIWGDTVGGKMAWSRWKVPPIDLA